MQDSLSLSLVGCLSENGFSLDELVLKVRELFETRAMAEVVAVLLSAVDERLYLALRGSASTWRPRPCCDAPDYLSHSRQARRLRTSVGTVFLHWRRLRCSRCGRTTVPLREFAGLDRWQSHSAELERTVVETVSQQSYRRGSRHLETIGTIPVPRSTAHRWVIDSDCDRVDPVTSPQDDPRPPLQVMVADGTGFKRQGPPEQSRRGEVRLVLGVDAHGRTSVLGAYSGRSWRAIGQSLREVHGEEGPLAEMLVCDGENGLAEALEDLAERGQRCHWHLVRDVGHFMWMDSAPLAKRRHTAGKLAAIIEVALPQDDLETVSATDRREVLARTQAAEQAIDELIEQLAGGGLQRAAGYLERAAGRLFSYVRFWLDTGVVCPRVSSWIERIMREVTRRLKKVGFNWSDRGAEKMTRIVVRQICDDEAWQAYWNNRMNIAGNVELIYQGVQLIT